MKRLQSRRDVVVASPAGNQTSSSYADRVRSLSVSERDDGAYADRKYLGNGNNDELPANHLAGRVHRKCRLR